MKRKLALLFISLFATVGLLGACVAGDDYDPEQDPMLEEDGGDDGLD